MSKTKEPSPAKPGRLDAAAPDAPSQPDERDAAIARLERTVAEERQNATTLREQNEALKFRLEILEKSYAKQLLDARQRGEVATKELATQKTRLAELGSGGEDTQRLLEETRAELNRIKAEQTSQREQPERGGAALPDYRKNAPRRAVEDSSQTINAMILSASVQQPREHEAAGDSNLGQRVRDEQPSGPAEVMVSPDLIFTDKDGEDDGEKAA